MEWIKYFILGALTWFIMWLCFGARHKHVWKYLGNEKHMNIGFRRKYYDVYECEVCGKWRLK